MSSFRREHLTYFPDIHTTNARVKVESGGSGGMSSESKLELCKLFALDISDAENACVGDLGFATRCHASIGDRLLHRLVSMEAETSLWSRYEANSTLSWFMREGTDLSTSFSSMMATLQHDDHSLATIFEAMLFKAPETRRQAAVQAYMRWVDARWSTLQEALQVTRNEAPKTNGVPFRSKYQYGDVRDVHRRREERKKNEPTIANLDKALAVVTGHDVHAVRAFLGNDFSFRRAAEYFATTLPSSALDDISKAMSVTPGGVDVALLSRTCAKSKFVLQQFCIISGERHYHCAVFEAGREWGPCESVDEMTGDRVVVSGSGVLTGFCQSDAKVHLADASHRDSIEAARAFFKKPYAAYPDSVRDSIRISRVFELVSTHQRQK